MLSFKEKLEILLRSIIMASVTGIIIQFVLQTVNKSDLNKSLSICAMFISYNIFFAMYYIVKTIKNNSSV